MAVAQPVAAAQNADQNRIVVLTNLERRKAALPPLKLRSELALAAQRHAEDMARRGYFDHVSPEGVQFDARAAQAGYRGQALGENIAMGGRDAAATMAMWMSSEGHRQNILDPDAREIGVGIAGRDRRAVMVLGRTQSASTLVLGNEEPTSASLQVEVAVAPATPATEMRLSENGTQWTEWRPFAATTSHRFAAGAGRRVLRVELRSGASSIPGAEDEILISGGPVQAVPIVFPMLGEARWTDTFGAPRDGGRRQHIGQDLMAEKMRPLLAAFDGVWDGMAVVAADGTRAVYIHINNDTPGSDDGQGGHVYAEAPGIWPGVRVLAGQFIAYNGDSGNAEETAPHLHFELWLPGVGVVNPAESLRQARVVAVPVHVPERPELLPQPGQIRWDAEVRQVDEARRVLIVDLAGTVSPDGKAEGAMRFTRRFVRLADLDVTPKPGDFIAVLGPEPPAGQAMLAAGVMVLRSRPSLK